MNIAVIGTAGRRDDQWRLSVDSFPWMMKQFSIIVDPIIENEKIMLYSGGAAWSDHVAVAYFLRERQNDKDMSN